MHPDAAWYRDPAARRFLALGYLPWLAALSLAWEVAQLPLYTILTDASAGYIAFAVAHCTAGDLMIGSAAVALALIAGRERGLERWHWRRIAATTAPDGHFVHRIQRMAERGCPSELGLLRVDAGDRDCRLAPRQKGRAAAVNPSMAVAARR